MIGDRKVTLGDGTDFDYEDKLFKDIHPIVVGSSGVSGLFDMFRSRVGAYVAEHRGQIGIQPFIMEIADITKELNDRYSPRLAGQRFDVLLGIQLSPTSALQYIYPFGFPEGVRKFRAIGHGEPYGSVFLKQLWHRNMTMEQTAELGCLIIRIIEKLELDASVGGKPQIWFVPDPSQTPLKDEDKPKYEVRGADDEYIKSLMDRIEPKVEKYKNAVKESASF